MILAESAATLAAAGTFWSAMLTTIPVLALALSVEAIRQVRSSTELGWKARATQTVLFAGYGLALILSFYISVDALAYRRGFDRAPIVGSMLSASLLLLVGIPLGDIAVRNNPEVRTVLVRMTPWSSWRRRRRKLRKGMKETQTLLEEIRENLEKRTAILTEAEQGLAEGLKAREQVAAMRRYHGSVPADVAETSWAEVERAAADAEVDLLQPGSMHGRVEFHAETVRSQLVRGQVLLGKVERLQRREAIALRGARMFRFTPWERNNFKLQLEMLRKEYSNLPESSAR